jgi:hypothetical protein
VDSGVAKTEFCLKFSFVEGLWRSYFMEIRVKWRRDTLLGFTCIFFIFYFCSVRSSDLEPRRWLEVVECENRVWELHLCKFEEICRPLDTERASAIDLPILVHLQAWR